MKILMKILFNKKNKKENLKKPFLCIEYSHHEYYNVA